MVIRSRYHLHLYVGFRVAYWDNIGIMEDKVATTRIGLYNIGRRTCS